MPLHPLAKDIAPNVGYEWKMLNWAYWQLERDLPRDVNGDAIASSIDQEGERGSLLIVLEVASGPDSNPDCNGLLEVFLLHARVLRDFLCKTPQESYDDDVLAEHFAPTNWQPLPLPATLKAKKKRLDKALAHLSFERIDYETSKEWNLTRIHGELTTMWDQFWASLPDDRKEWFDLHEEGWDFW